LSQVNASIQAECSGGVKQGPRPQLRRRSGLRRRMLPVMRRRQGSHKGAVDLWSKTLCGESKNDSASRGYGEV